MSNVHVDVRQQMGAGPPLSPSADTAGGHCDKHQQCGALRTVTVCRVEAGKRNYGVPLVPNTCHKRSVWPTLKRRFHQKEVDVKCSRILAPLPPSYSLIFSDS